MLLTGSDRSDSGKQKLRDRGWKVVAVAVALWSTSSKQLESRWLGGFVLAMILLCLLFAAAD